MCSTVNFVLLKSSWIDSIYLNKSRIKDCFLSHYHIYYRASANVWYRQAEIKCRLLWLLCMFLVLSSLSAFSIASHDLSLFFPLCLFHHVPLWLSIHLCVFIFVFSVPLMFAVILPCTCILVSFFSFLPLGGSVLIHILPIFLSSLAYFLFPHHFKLLVQFSSRAVVGLKAAQWHWAPILARQAVDVGSSPRSPTPRDPGWLTRLPIPLLCILCPARPLWVPAG